MKKKTSTKYKMAAGAVVLRREHVKGTLQNKKINIFLKFTTPKFSTQISHELFPTNFPAPPCANSCNGSWTSDSASGLLACLRR